MMKLASKACAYHILVKTEQECLAIKDKLAKGGDFNKLAKQYSTCPSRKRGGDLGEFNRGDMVKPFDDVVFKNALFEVHGPVKTKFGYHLIKTVYRS